MREEQKNRETTPCKGCGGSGQTGFFGGESRFMITWEDCPDCAGTGIELPKVDKTPDSKYPQKT